MENLFGNWELETGNRELGIGNWERGAVSILNLGLFGLL